MLQPELKEFCGGVAVGLRDGLFDFGRTFILPGNDERTNGVRLKLSVTPAPCADADADELISNRLGSVQQVARYVGVDELRSLDEDGLRRATLFQNFCMACINGRYPL